MSTTTLDLAVFATDSNDDIDDWMQLVVIYLNIQPIHLTTIFRNLIGLEFDSRI